MKWAQQNFTASIKMLKKLFVNATNFSLARKKNQDTAALLSNRL